MGDTALRKVFDEAGRTRVRAALRRYMTDHGIGVPTLRTRIIEADKPRHRDIPLTTLQRFLRDKHRTSDHHVALCDTFLDAVGASSAGPDFAQAVAAFYAPGAEKAGERLAGLVGNYVGSELPIADVDPVRPPQTMRVCSELTLTSGAMPGALLVEERHYGNAIPAPRVPRERFEGALVPCGLYYHLFLRSSVTRQPKTCTMVWMSADGSRSATPWLEGQASVTTVVPAPRSGLPVRSTFLVRLHPVQRTVN